MMCIRTVGLRASEVEFADRVSNGRFWSRLHLHRIGRIRHCGASVGVCSIWLKVASAGVESLVGFDMMTP